MFLIHSIYDEAQDFTYLDKSFSEIVEHLPTSACLIVDSFSEGDMVGSWADIVCSADNYTGENSVTTISVSYEDNQLKVVMKRYKEADGVLKFDLSDTLPQIKRSFTFTESYLDASTQDVMNAVQFGNSVVCFFIYFGTTGSAHCYTATEFGHNGDTYYVVLSNGWRFEGAWDDSRMNRVNAS